jgi:hypothetical protein
MAFLTGDLGRTLPIGLSLSTKQPPSTDPFADAVAKSAADLASPSQTRDQRTSVALAKAQAQGSKQAIIAAANVRLRFVRDTIAFGQKLISEHRGNTNQLTQTLQSLFGEEASDEQIISQIQDDAAAKAKAIRDKRAAKEKAATAASARAAKKEAREIAQQNRKRFAELAKQLAAGQKFTKSFQTLLGQRAQENQFLALGLTRTGDTLAPSKGSLQAELKKVQAGLSGTILDTDPNRNLLAKIRKVLGGQFDSLTRETRLKVKELLDALTGDTRGGPATARSAASISRLIAGTGLQGAALRRLEFNLAGAHLTVPVSGIRPIHVHTTVNLDGREIASNTTLHQEADGRRRPFQTRGRQTNARSL